MHFEYYSPTKLNRMVGKLSLVIWLASWSSCWGQSTETAPTTNSITTEFKYYVTNATRIEDSSTLDTTSSTTSTTFTSTSSEEKSIDNQLNLSTEKVYTTTFQEKQDAQDKDSEHSAQSNVNTDMRDPRPVISKFHSNISLKQYELLNKSMVDNYPSQYVYERIV